MVTPGEIDTPAQPQVTPPSTAKRQKGHLIAAMMSVGYVLIVTHTARIALFATKRGHLHGSEVTDEYLPI